MGWYRIIYGCHYRGCYSKKFNKWVDIGVFDTAYSEFLQLYKDSDCSKLNEQFIDATILKNTCCSKNITGFCKKLPNKLSTKATFICDENKIGMAVVFHPSGIHDSKHIEEAIDNIPEIVSSTFTYNRPCILTADKGYIINKQRNRKIRRTQNVSVNYCPRRNMKVNKTDKNKKLLKKE